MSVATRATVRTPVWSRRRIWTYRTFRRKMRSFRRQTIRHFASPSLQPLLPNSSLTRVSPNSSSSLCLITVSLFTGTGSSDESATSVDPEDEEFELLISNSRTTHHVIDPLQDRPFVLSFRSKPMQRRSRRRKVVRRNRSVH